MKKIIVDLDGTLCEPCFEKCQFSKYKGYRDAKPIKKNIDRLNALHGVGDEYLHITIWTSRGMDDFEGDVEKIKHAYEKMTEVWLEENNVNYSELKFGKPSYDLFIDDKSENWTDDTEEEFVERIFAKKEKPESIPVTLNKVVDKPSFKIEEDCEDPWLQK